MLADKENNAQKLLTKETKNLLTSIPKDENFIIEISNNELIIGNRKPLTEVNFKQITDFLKNKI